jgi:hypothetical protein
MTYPAIDTLTGFNARRRAVHARSGQIAVRARNRKRSYVALAMTVDVGLGLPAWRIYTPLTGCLRRCSGLYYNAALA